MPNRRAIGTSAGLYLSGVLYAIIAAMPAAGAEYHLLMNSDEPGISAALPHALPTDPAWVQRARPVALNPLIAASALLAEGDQLRLDLFPDAVYAARVDRVTTQNNGTVTVRARLDGFPMGYLLISTTEGQSLGSISIPEQGKEYRIVMAPETQTHRLLDVAADQLDDLEDASPLIPPAAAEEPAKAAPLAAGPLDPATVDVMIAYTPAAKTWAGGDVAIANVIAQAMAKAQLALDNSNTVITMRLVHAAETSYTESGSSSTDLSRLTSTSDGYMDEIHTWRNLYGVDLTCLFTSVQDTGGIGWLLNTTSGSPGYAFCITRVQQASWTYTTIHEWGHNMGCHHHKQQNVQPGPGLFSYAAGWRWTGTDGGHYCSVMTYEDGSYFPDGITHTRVGYFSNPSINHIGQPTGDATNGDNARTLREIKQVIAAYRPSGTDITPPTIIDRVPAPGSTITSAAVNVDVTFSESVTGVDATDLVLSGTSALSASKGTPTNTTGNTWRFPISGLVNGTLNLSLAPDANDMEDLAGNDLANATWSNPVQVQYCAASGGSCYEYIKSVQVGSINNTNTACGTYADYTSLSTTMTIGTGYPITVTNGTPYSDDQCGIWVDWNKNGSFTDAGEMVTVSGTPGGGPYTATITPPAGAVTGNTRMRVRIMWTGTLDSCGTTLYGEVEDYTITVPACVPPTAPTSASSDRDYFCSADPGTINLYAVGGSGATLRWFTGSCGGTSVGTGSPLTIASPAATTTYYARWENSCGNSTCASVTVTVNTSVAPDFDGDCDVDASDMTHMVDCTSGPQVPQSNTSCLNARLDGDSDVDHDDFGKLQRCLGNSGVTPNPNCAQ